MLYNNREKRVVNDENEALQLHNHYIPYSLVDETGIEIGKGGSIVYQTNLRGYDDCNNIVMKVKVAIKNHNCECKSNRNWKQEVLYNLALRGNSHVVTCYGWTRRSATCASCRQRMPCIVYEYAQFGPLSKVLDHGHKEHNMEIPLHKKKLKWLMDSLRGIVQLHSQNLIHRDLKPDNILVFVTNKEEIILKIADLDLARFDNKSSDGKGNPLYAAPERRIGESGVMTSDVYSWALIAIEILLHSNGSDREDRFQPCFYDHEDTANVKMWRKRVLRYLRIEELSEITQEVIDDRPEDELNRKLLDLLFVKCLAYNKNDRDTYGRPSSQEALNELESIVNEHKQNCPVDNQKVDKRLTRYLEHLQK